MKIVLLRVGTDSGCRPIHANGPLFPDGSFELVPIPDHSARSEHRTYGNTVGRHGHPLVDYFPERRAAIADFPLHVDPEFDTCTYGTPTRLQRRLATLEAGDMLVFYGGLRAVTEKGAPIRDRPHSLYLFGYFEVQWAVRTKEYSREQLLPTFAANFHVRHPNLFAPQQNDLVLVQGGPESRLLTKALPISDKQPNRLGRPTFVLSEEMREVFGPLPGLGSIERCAPRWIDSNYTAFAAAFIRALA